MLNKKNFKRSLSMVIMSIIVIFILTENYIEANAIKKISNKPLQLEVKVKNKNTATMILKGIKVPDKIPVESLDEDRYNYEIQFNDLSVSALLFSSGESIEKFKNQEGLEYITPEKFQGIVWSKQYRYGGGHGTGYTGKYDIKFKYTKDSMTFDVTINDPKLDFTKLDFYSVNVQQGKNFMEKDFLASKGKVIPIPKNHMLNMNINYQGRIEHTGKEIKPYVNVKDGNKTLKLNTDYTVTYKDNKDVGSGRVIIKGKGKYIGYVSKVFDILAKGPEIKSVSKVDDGIKIEWVPEKNATGYIVYYGTDKNQYNYLGNVFDTTQSSYIASGLEKGKTYTFYIVSNYQVDGFTNQSEFSKGKSIKY